MVEVITAIAVLSIVSLGTVSSILSTARVDESLRERMTALRAASSRMEAILAFDYATDIGNLVTHLQQPAESSFAIDALAPPKITDLNAAVQALVPLGQAPTCGHVEVISADAYEVQLSVSVSWTSRGGKPCNLNLPMTVSKMDWK